MAPYELARRRRHPCVLRSASFCAVAHYVLLSPKGMIGVPTPSDIYKTIHTFSWFPHPLPASSNLLDWRLVASVPVGVRTTTSAQSAHNRLCAGRRSDSHFVLSNLPTDERASVIQCHLVSSSGPHRTLCVGVVLGMMSMTSSSTLSLVCFRFTAELGSMLTLIDN